MPTNTTHIGQVEMPTNCTVSKSPHVLNECLRDVAASAQIPRAELLQVMDEAAGRFAYAAETLREIEALFDAIRALGENLCTSLLLAKTGSDMAGLAAHYFEADTARLNQEVRNGGF